MHNSYHFLFRWIKEIGEKIEGAEVLDCFSQNPGELILLFSGNEPVYLKAYLTNEIAYCSTFNEFSKSKKNVRPWFRSLIGKRVKTIGVYSNERAFYLDFKNSKSRLVFKMYGSRSNVVYFDAERKVHAVFNKKLKIDYSLPYDLSRDLDLSFEKFESVSRKEFLPTFDKNVWSYLKNQGFEELDEKGQYETLIYLNEFLLSSQIQIDTNQAKPHLSLLPNQQNAIWNGFDTTDALRQLEKLFFSEYALELEKGKLENAERKRLKKLLRDKAKLGKRYSEIIDGANKKELADVIMANLYLMSSGNEFDLYDFYNEKNILVNIPKNEKPQLTASKLYRKHKNQHLEEGNIKQLLDSKDVEIDKVLEKIERIKNNKDWRSLRKLRGVVATKNKVAPILKFKEFEFFGYNIYVGRNSKNNDELTLKFAKKDDLWLHAKDVAGSHVVIKKKGDQTVPKNVVEYAAMLAGKYSKRKNDSLCPVTVTPKKYVRKVKGAPAGAVFVEREDVVLVRLN